MIHLPLVFTLVGSLLVCFATYAVLRRDDPFLDGGPFLAPPQIDTMLDRAEAHLLMGRLTEAMGLARKAARYDPDNPRAFLLLARIYAARGRREQALEITRRLLARFPNYQPARELVEALEG